MLSRFLILMPLILPGCISAEQRHLENLSVIQAARDIEVAKALSKTNVPIIQINIGMPGETLSFKLLRENGLMHVTPPLTPKLIPQRIK